MLKASEPSARAVTVGNVRIARGVAGCPELRMPVAVISITYPCNEIAGVRDYNYLFIYTSSIGIVQLLGNGARFRKPNTIVRHGCGLPVILYRTPRKS